MLWLFTQIKGQENNSNISCMLQVSIVAISYFDNKPISILSTTFSPINHVGVTFKNWWHLINSLEILTSPMLVHYHDRMCEVNVHDEFHGYYSKCLQVKMFIFGHHIVFFLNCYGLRRVLCQIFI
jgi:hypothetical protein